MVHCDPTNNERNLQQSTDPDRLLLGRHGSGERDHSIDQCLPRFLQIPRTAQHCCPLRHHGGHDNVSLVPADWPHRYGTPTEAGSHVDYSIYSGSLTLPNNIGNHTSSTLGLVSLVQERLEPHQGVDVVHRHMCRAGLHEHLAHLHRGSRPLDNGGHLKQPLDLDPSGWSPHPLHSVLVRQLQIRAYGVPG
jgi:hypothetical protein